MLTACASSQDKSWTRTFPKETGEYKFYVGRGSSSKTEVAAFNQAVKDAYDQAARENFGIRRQYGAEIYQTESDSYLTERTVEQGYSARFDSFDKIDQHIELNKNRYDVWLLYRFSKKAIEKEKARLRTEGDKPEKRELSVIGSTKNAAKGILEIETTPVDGALIYINGDRYGQTPIRLIGALPTGKHTLRIDHPDYKTITETIIVVPNKTVRIEKILVPAFAEVSATTNPVNADIYMDDKKVGTAPMVFQAPVGKKINLRFSHPETEDMITPLNLKKDDHKKLAITLVEKPAKFSVFSFPNDATVYLDRTKIGQTPLRNLAISRGSHSYTVTKDGYATVTKAFYAKGDENITESIELSTYKKGAEIISSNTITLSTNVVDKTHQFELILPTKKKPVISPAASAEETLMGLMEWSFPTSIVTARGSYKSIGNNRIRFFVFLSFNPESYQKEFIEPMDLHLRTVGENRKETTLSVPCTYEAKIEGQTQCLPPKQGTSDTIFVKTGSIEHGFWSDEAPFTTYSLLTARDGRRDTIAPYEKMAFVVTLYGRDDKKLRTIKENFYITKFHTDKNRNVIFMPSFGNGFESFVMLENIPVAEADIERVTLEITSGTPEYELPKKQAPRRAKR